MTKPKINHVSMLDHPWLTANARYGVAVSAQAIASAYQVNGITERSFDDLDWFEIVVLDVDGLLLGFREYLNQPNKPYCVVACLPDDAPNAIDVIAQIAGVERSAVDVSDGRW